MRIVVCPAARAAEVAAQARPGLVISLHAPGRSPPSLPPEIRHLAFAFHDIVEPRSGLVAPAPGTIAAILTAGRSCEGPMMVACELGISRSTAIAFALACQSAPTLPEIAVAEALRVALPFATPNRLIVALADARLDRDGAMVAAAAAIGRGADYAPYRSFVLDLGSIRPG